MNPSLPLDTESFLAEADTDTFLFSRLYIQVSLIYKCSVTSDGWIKSHTSIKNQPRWMLSSGSNGHNRPRLEKEIHMRMGRTHLLISKSPESPSCKL